MRKGEGLMFSRSSPYGFDLMGGISAEGQSETESKAFEYLARKAQIQSDAEKHSSRDELRLNPLRSFQVVVDNFSRYVLAWQVLSSYDGSKTAALLEQALLRAGSQKLSLIVDGGSENKGPDMRNLEALGRFKKKVSFRILAARFFLS
jgi:hypothetical protein